MRARVVLLLSLGLNLVLAGMIVLLSSDSDDLFSGPAYLVAKKKETQYPRLVRTNVIVRRQPFTWSEIESDDYPLYIANLRKIGCPEKTIRDIITADVNELFNERIHREVVLPEQQWWKADPDMDVVQAAADQIAALEAEKQRMLEQLLGPGINPSPTTIAGLPIRLDGPVLSQLSPQTRAEIYKIEAAARTAYDDYLKSVKGIPDQTKLVQLRNQVRTDLARILTPEQLEEYLLRYSWNARDLRQQLRGFGADAEEFRKIFRARDALDQQIAALTGTDAATVQRKRELERMREEAIRQNLGEDRYQLYRLTETPLFRVALRMAEEIDAPPEKALPIVAIHQAAQQEKERIEKDPNLSEDDRVAALQLIQNQQEESIRKVLAGEPAEPPIPQ